MIRLATLPDLECLFTWRNDPEFVGLSTDKRTVTWEEHLAWWWQNEGRIWIVVDSDLPCGVVHLTRTDTEAFRISISITQSHRRKGLAQDAIQTIIHALPTIRLIAKMEPYNLASPRLFERCGFATTQMEWLPTITGTEP